MTLVTSSFWIPGPQRFAPITLSSGNLFKMQILGPLAKATALLGLEVLGRGSATHLLEGHLYKVWPRGRVQLLETVLWARNSLCFTRELSGMRSLRTFSSHSKIGQGGAPPAYHA